METMDSNLASPCKKTISSEDSRDSNAAPDNFAVVATTDVNWKDETSDAPKMTAMENGMEQQSNDGNETSANDGIQVTNLNVGKMETLTENRHLHANGLKDKNLKFVKKEGKIVMMEKENRHFHANGLNDKNMKIAEKGEKVVWKERENRHSRVNGLNDNIIGMSAEWSESRVEMESKFRRQRQIETKDERDQYGRRPNEYNQDRDEWINMETDAEVPIRSDIYGQVSFSQRFRRRKQVLTN